MTKEELEEVLLSHVKGRKDPSAGERANLRDANLQDANLRDANLQDANLQGANLQDANLRFAVLRDANLRGADLQGANLQGANLRDANLRGADLQGANLQGANLAEARGVRFAQVAFAGHGERGRQLLAVVIGEEVKFFCGCFSGTEADLREYILHGDPHHHASRTLAADFVIAALKMS